MNKKEKQELIDKLIRFINLFQEGKPVDEEAKFAALDACMWRIEELKKGPGRPRNNPYTIDTAEFGIACAYAKNDITWTQAKQALSELPDHIDADDSKLERMLREMKPRAERMNAFEEWLISHSKPTGKK